MPFATSIGMSVQPSTNNPKSGLSHTACGGLSQTAICGVTQTVLEVSG